MERTDDEHKQKPFCGREFRLHLLLATNWYWRFPYDHLRGGISHLSFTVYQSIPHRQAPYGDVILPSAFLCCFRRSGAVSLSTFSFHFYLFFFLFLGSLYFHSILFSTTFSFRYHSNLLLNLWCSKWNASVAFLCTCIFWSNFFLLALLLFIRIFFYSLLWHLNSWHFKMSK